MYKYEKPFGDERIGASLKDLSIAIDKYSTNPLKDKIKFIDWILFNLIVFSVREKLRYFHWLIIKFRLVGIFSGNFIQNVS